MMNEPKVGNPEISRKPRNRANREQINHASFVILPYVASYISTTSVGSTGQNMSDFQGAYSVLHVHQVVHQLVNVNLVNVTR